MPGRGTPWKEGGHIDETILGEDIKDGSISEADLDSALTSKVNQGGHDIQDEGTPIASQTNLNFIGAGVTAVFGAEDTTTVTIPGGSSGHIIEDEGTPLAAQPDLNFVGAGVTATNDSENTATVITIPGGSGITRELVSNPDTDLYFYDEFFYPNPATYLDVHYEKAGTFVAPTAVTGGQVQFTTSTVANNVARINTCGAGLTSIDPTKNFRQVWRARGVTSDANIAILFGFYNDQGSKPSGTFPFSSVNPDYAVFRKDGVGNWFAQIHDGVTPSSTDTGVVSDTLMHTFEIRSDPVAPNIEFLIDGAIVATFTTNLPNNDLASFAGVMTGTTAQRQIVVDSFYLYQDR